MRWLGLGSCTLPTVGSADRIVDAIPRTRLALVAFFSAVAVEHWAGQEATQAGRALDAAVDELVAAAGMGTVLDQTTAAAIGRARWFADRLRSGAARTADEFRQGHEAVETALERLRKSFDDRYRPRRSAASRRSPATRPR